MSSRDGADVGGEALATATRTPGLNRDFIARVARPPGSEDGFDDLAALLHQGVFSTPMLLAAARVADASVFSGTSPVVAALSRNPAAAQQFLLAPYDPTAAGGQPRRDPDALLGLATGTELHRTNLDALLGHRFWDDGGTALGDLLAAATTDPPGADPQRSAQLTSDLVKAVASRQIPLLDPVRDSLAGIVAAHPDWFTLHFGSDGGPLYPDPDSGLWFPVVSQADEETFLVELMRSATATNMLVVGASAYLLRELEDPRLNSTRVNEAGRLFAMLDRANDQQLAHAHDAAQLVPAVLGLARAAPQGRAIKDTELAVGSFVQIVLDLDTWHSRGPTFRDRLVDALDATRAEALWHSGRVGGPRKLGLTVAPDHTTLKPYAEIQQDPRLRSAYWKWVHEVTQTGDPYWDGVVAGFIEHLGPGS